MAASTSYTGQPMLANELTNLVRNLSDSSQRDDFKLKALQDIWSQIDVYNSATVFSPHWENLIRCFLKLFAETSPQFISENNTQQLRKLMLEIILPTSTHEALKNMSKEIQKTMLRLITIENEENAILAIKILLDQGKTSKFQFSQEMTNVYGHLRKIMREMCSQVCNSRMFELRELRPSAQLKEEMLIEEYLRDCFYSMSVYLNPSSEAKYNLIPRASQSVKVIQELPMLIVLFYQHYKGNLQQETSEFLQCCLQYLSLQIPADMINSPNLNKNLVDEFYVSQAKILTFVNSMGKIGPFLEVILANGQFLVNSVMLLLENCPPDAIAVRKDVLMTLKFFFTSDLRSKFITVLPRLVSETHLLGTGFTSVDQLRSSMYHILADLLHHMRNQFTFPMLSHVAFVFCRQLHDNTVTVQVQIMSARLLNSITETMGKMEQQGEPARDLLLQILECLVTKLKVLSVYHVPLLLQQHVEDATNGDSILKEEKADVGNWHSRRRRASIDSLDELEMPNAEEIASEAPQSSRPSTELSTPQAIMSAYWAIPGPPLHHADAKNLVKYVLHTCKCVAFQLKETKLSNESIPMARERDIFERLLKYGIECLEVFTIAPQNNFARNSMAQQQAQANRSKEEKESLEALSTIFTNLDQDVFREIFSKYMDYLIERIFKNVPLQLMVNIFLVRGESCFGSLLLRYLMGKLPALTANNERTGLYVKLFKIIFSAVGAIAAQVGGGQPNEAGELMLKPYLPDMIRKSTEFALTANDPLNYFLLLRALFRSIGGGAHDILYSQFLPLLPNLLYFLNKLQSCQHVVQMRELFVELCLTVPVRLSSLLPYLPLLMDPLVCALHGSTSLVQQGLRTLELCVDNLQPEYLFEHLAPVRGALMQGLWKVVGSSIEGNSAATAFRILGKFGGANRRMLNEPQQLRMISEAESMQSLITMRVEREGRGTGEETQQREGQGEGTAGSVACTHVQLNLALSDIVKNALEYIRSTTPPNDQIAVHFPFPQNHHPIIQQNAHQIRNACFELASAILLSGLRTANFDADCKLFNFTLSQPLKQRLQNIELLENMPIYKCPREADRTLYVNSLAIIIFGMCKKDLRQHLKFFNAVVRTLCVQSILECSAPWQSRMTGDSSLCMDSAVLIDALVLVLSDMNNRLTHSAVTVIHLIRDTFQLIFSPALMSRIPLCRYMMDNLLTLCHGPAWFVRLGGAGGFLYVAELFPAQFLAIFQKTIVKGCIEVIIGLVDEISSGAIDTAVDALRKLQNKLLDKDSANDEYLFVFVSHYAPHLFHTSSSTRQLILSLLTESAQLAHLQLHQLLYNYRFLFHSEIQRALTELEKQRIYEQEARLEALSVLLPGSSPIIPLSLNDENLQLFLQHMLEICTEDVSLLILKENYKCVEGCPAHFLPPQPIATQLESLKATAIKACVAFGHCLSLCDESMEVEEQRGEQKTKAIDSRRLYETAIEAMLYGKPIVQNSAYQALLQWKASISEQITRSFAYPISSRIVGSDEFLPEDSIRLQRLSQLNENVLTRDVIYQLANHLTTWNGRHLVEEVRAVHIEALSTTIKLLSQSALSSAREATAVAFFAAAFEYDYLTDEPLGWHEEVFSLASRFPRELLSAFVSLPSIQSQPRRALLRRLLKHPASELIRNLIVTDFSFIENLLELRAMNDTCDWVESEQTELETMERELLALSIVEIVSRLYPQWLTSSTSPVFKLREMWNSGEFKKRYVVRSPTETDDEARQLPVQQMTFHKYRAPKLILNSFIRYLRQNSDDFELLFDALICFIGNYVTDFCFVREFLEKEIIPKRSIAWRRDAFLKIMEKFETNPEKTCNDLRTVKVIQYLLMPCLQWAFERYDVDEIIGSPAQNAEQNEGEQSSENGSLVYRLVRVVDLHRQKMSDSMIIVFYQLCTLFVKYSPHHIHNNNSKKQQQGGRLRIFMLFAWPCLTHNNHQDPTLRSTGFNFLAHIIEKFTINRKIVLQVFNALCSTYQLDNREMVRRAADLLTPAVPVRMEDGYQQILAAVNKVLIEEAHNSLHVHHVLQMILRNYRVYYSVRQFLLPVLLNTLNKAITFPGGINEGINSRRLAVDTCEMALKWDILRRVRQERTEPEDMNTDNESELAKRLWKEEEMKVDKILERLKASENTMEDPMAVLEQSNGTEEGRTGKGTGNGQVVGRERPLEDIRSKAICKEHIDDIVNMLFRFAIQSVPSQQPASVVQSVHEAKQRCIQLLRVALKSTMWGNIVTIRVNFLEKNLAVTQEMVTAARHEAATQHNSSTACSQAQSALELLLYLCEVMPKSLLLDIVRPLQRVIITCLNSGIHTLVRGVIALVSRLFDKTDFSEAGITEVDTLNSYIARNYIGEQLTNFYKMPGGSAAQIALPILMLKTICTKESAYVEKTILHVFLRVTEKITKEHVAACGTGFDAHREKANIDVIITAYELLRQKVQSLNPEVRRAVATSVLAGMMDKTPSERIIESILKIIKEYVIHHSEENPATPGIHLMIRMQQVIDRRFKSNKELMLSLLNTVLVLLESEKFRDNELIDRLEPAFHWGLIHSDTELRERFLLAFERRLPSDVVERLIYLMQRANWYSFGEYYWLKHAIWFILRCVPRDNARRSAFIQCASLHSTIQAAFECLSASAPPNSQPSQPSSSEDMDKLVEEIEGLFRDAELSDFSSKLPNIYYLMFTVHDTSFVMSIWCELFTSLWNWMTDSEKEQVHGLIDSFLSSGIHTAQTRGEKSVLVAWLRALTNAIPHIQLSPDLLKHLASSHHAWHSGLLLLEAQALTSPRMIDAAQHIHDDTAGPHIRHCINVLENLSEVYEELGEIDQLAAAWGRRAMLPNTERIIQWVQMGEMEAVVEFIEQLSVEMYERMTKTPEEERHVRDVVDAEYDLWMDTYKKSCMELQRWTCVRDMCANTCMQNLRGLLQVAPHIPDWNLASDCIEQIGACVPRGFLPQFSLYNAMNHVMKEDENAGTEQHKQRLGKAIEEAQAIHIARWRALPSVISNSHVKILQSMNIIRDIADCVELRVALASSGAMFNAQVLNDMKTVIKIWRNRTPAMSDEVSFVSTVSNWRCQIHTMVIHMFQQWEMNGCQMPTTTVTTSSPTILPIHSAATGTLAVARACRNMGFLELAIHNLNRMHAMPMLPLMDAHQKICENVKVLRAISRDERTQPNDKKRALYEALEIIENVKIDELHRDQICRLMYQKGAALGELGLPDEAAKAFSAAAQVHDSTSYSGSNSCNVYKVWGQHLHRLFTENISSQPAHSTTAAENGLGAVKCYLEASRVDCESKARKCILRLIWVVRNLHEIGEGQAVDDLLCKHARSIAPFNWLHWLPQLLQDLLTLSPSGPSSLILRIASTYPMQTLYALRCAIGDDAFSHLFDTCTRSAETELQPLSLQAILKSVLSTRASDAKTFYRLLCELRDMKEYWVEKHIRYADECIKEVEGALHKERQRDAEKLEEVKAEGALTDRARALFEQWRRELDDASDSWMIKEQEVELSTSDTPQPMSEEQFIASIHQAVSSIDLSVTSLFQLLDQLLSIYQLILTRFSRLPRKVPIELTSEYLCKYNYRVGCVEMPSDLLNVLKTGQYNSLFGRFGRYLEVEVDGDVLAKRLEIRAQTGKSSTFVYRKRVLLKGMVGERRKEISREMQLLQHVNGLLLRDRATSRRHLSVCNVTQLHVSDCGILMEIANVQPYYRQPQSEVLRPHAVLAKCLYAYAHLPHRLIQTYFRSIAQLRETMNMQEACNAAFRNLSSENEISPSLLQRYLCMRYPDTTSYYMLRKQIARGLSVLSLLEFSCHFSPLQLDQMHIIAITGQFFNPDYVFETNQAGEHPVPFRLSPNMRSLLGFAVEGDMRWSMWAVAHCLVERQADNALRVLLWDEIMQANGNEKSAGVCAKVDAMTRRAVDKAKDLASNPQAIVTLLIEAADPEHLSHMQPLYHPWF